ncbi:hypothetical protein ACOYW6_11315 [Parablastomonas sp. CN1-191]|uniref:hypothetical protein n=1 Tax=Parablastomonas sp. CN1-191 TaxID=3400908 RepID=UPI003BF922A2
MTSRTIAITLAAALAAAPALAKDEPPAPPPVYRAVLDCRAVTDGAARLACYDRAVTAMDAAQKRQELVVTDRASIREAQRGLFGLTLPKIKLFGGSDADEVKEITSTIRSVRQGSDQLDVFVLEDGSRWKQTEGRNTFAHVGDAIRVRRTGMGGYMANVREQPGIRVIRLAN